VEQSVGAAVDDGDDVSAVKSEVAVQFWHCGFAAIVARARFVPTLRRLFGGKATRSLYGTNAAQPRLSDVRHRWGHRTLARGRRPAFPAAGPPPVMLIPRSTN